MSAMAEGTRRLLEILLKPGPSSQSADEYQRHLDAKTNAASDLLQSGGLRPTDMLLLPSTIGSVAGTFGVVGAMEVTKVALVLAATSSWDMLDFLEQTCSAVAANVPEEATDYKGLLSAYIGKVILEAAKCEP